MQDCLLITIECTQYLQYRGREVLMPGYSIYIYRDHQACTAHVNCVTFRWGKWAIYWKVFSAKYTPSSKTNPSKVNGN